MEMQGEFRGILQRFRGQRILVAGDVILDRYWWGNATRLSPEAPVPVVRRLSSSTKPGGAANTAANLAALGASPELFGVTGTDREAGELKAALAEAGISGDCLYAEPGRPTTTKTRVMALNQQVVRVDDESTAPISDAAAAAMMERVAERVDGAAAIVISDYAKGFLTPALLQFLMRAAKEAGTPVFVDPKGADYARYAGCTLLKPNRLELSLLTGMPAHDHPETAAAGRRLSALMPDTHILVTEGADGMTLFADSDVRERVAAAPRQVYDVTGAGDTVLATMALAVTAGASYRGAMQLAAEAASIAIGLMGTAAVTLEQLESALMDQAWLARACV
jgi:D-beta-D-heptose 7-phosphate kinase/D-beta-D-heptose 1-phosphate adenosyltransferase